MGVSEIHQSSQVSMQREVLKGLSLCVCCTFDEMSENNLLYLLVLLRGQVTSLSVHPSGKLALTVGTDKTLRYISPLRV